MNEISEPYEGFFDKMANKRAEQKMANVRYEGFSDPPFGKKMSDDVIINVQEVENLNFDLIL